MTRVVVAGWGQALRTDDGVGRQVVEEIAARWAERVDVLHGVQPLPEWAPVLAAADHAFLVDASTDVEVEHVHVLRISGRACPAGLAGHGLSPWDLLSLTQTLYGRAPSADLVLVPAAQFSFGQTLSPRAARGTTDALHWLDCALKRILDSSPESAAER
jgi:hydrogenase maturation protease